MLCWWWKNLSYYPIFYNKTQTKTITQISNIERRTHYFTTKGRGRYGTIMLCTFNNRTLLQLSWKACSTVPCMVSCRVSDGMRSRGAWSWGVQEGEEEGQWAWMLDLQDTWWTDGALDSRNRPAVAACRTTRRERERTEVCFTDPEPEYCIGHKFRGIWISRMTVIMAFTDLIFTKKCQHRYAHNKFLLSRF